MAETKWRAIVSNNDDPERRFRIKVYIPDAYQDPITGRLDESDWMLPAHAGISYAPAVGSGVWVEWEAGFGTPHKGVWSGEYPSLPDGLSEIINIAQEALAGDTPYGRGLYDVFTPDFTDLHADAPPSFTFTEPESFQATEYPKCKVLHSPAKKAIIELDDTGDGRVHEHVGDYYREVTGDGAEAKRVGSSFTRITEHEFKHVDGPQTESVAGPAIKDYEDDLAVRVARILYGMITGMHVSVGGTVIDAGKDSPGFSLECPGAVDITAMSRLLIMAQMATLAGSAEARVMAPSAYLESQSLSPVSPTTGQPCEAGVRSPYAEMSVGLTGATVNARIPSPLPFLPPMPVVCMTLVQAGLLKAWIAAAHAALTTLNPLMPPPPVFFTSPYLTAGAV